MTRTTRKPPAKLPTARPRVLGTLTRVADAPYHVDPEYARMLAGQVRVSGCGCKHKHKAAHVIAERALLVMAQGGGLTDPHERRTLKSEVQVADAQYKANVGMMWKLLASAVYGQADLLIVGVREALQNSRDAGATEFRVTLANDPNGKVLPPANTWNAPTPLGVLTIADNGDGMTEKIIRDKFLSLGDTTKLANAVATGDKVALGGFGVAKAAILGTSSSMSWDLHSGEFVFRGRPEQDAPQVFHTTKTVKGVSITLHEVPLERKRLPGIDRQFTPMERLRAFFQRCYLPRMKLILNGEEIEPLFVHSKGSRERDYETGWGPLTEVEVRSYRAKGDLAKPEFIVRLRGIYHFNKVPSEDLKKFAKHWVVDVTKIKATPQETRLYPLSIDRSQFKWGTIENRRLDDIVSNVLEKERPDDAADYEDFLPARSGKTREAFQEQIKGLANSPELVKAQETLLGISAEVQQGNLRVLKRMKEAQGRTEERHGEGETVDAAPTEAQTEQEIIVEVTEALGGASGGKTHDVQIKAAPKTTTRSPVLDFIDELRPFLEGIYAYDTDHGRQLRMVLDDWAADERGRPYSFDVFGEASITTRGGVPEHTKKYLVISKFIFSAPEYAATGTTTSGPEGSTVMSLSQRASKLMVWFANLLEYIATWDLGTTSAQEYTEASATVRGLLDTGKTWDGAVYVKVHKDYDRRVLGQFLRSGFQRNLKLIVVWEAMAQMMAKAYKIPRTFGTGFLLEDSVNGMWTNETPNGVTYILINPDNFNDTAFAPFKKRPVLLTMWLHALLSHELAHFYGTKHDQDFSMAREAIARQSTHLMPVFEQIVIRVFELDIAPVLSGPTRGGVPRGGKVSAPVSDAKLLKQIETLRSELNEARDEAAMHKLDMESLAEERDSTRRMLTTAEATIGALMGGVSSFAQSLAALAIVPIYTTWLEQHGEAVLGAGISGELLLAIKADPASVSGWILREGLAQLPEAPLVGATAILDTALTHQGRSLKSGRGMEPWGADTNSRWS